MPALVDIHAHLLPGIDDGPSDLAGSLAMASAAVGAGTGTIAVTPHLRSDFPDVHVEELSRRCAELRVALSGAGIRLRVVEGAEVSLPWALEAGEESLRLASYGQLGRDVLVETPHEASVLPRLLEPLLERGLRVTLAHPERSTTFHRRPELMAELGERGVLGQVNAGALLASRHNPTRKCAERLCRAGLVQVIASDGHRQDRPRPVTVLSDAVQAAADVVGANRAAWMASDAPAAIIEGRSLPPAPAIESSGRRDWRLLITRGSRREGE